MHVDEAEIVSRAARRLRMPVSQVAEVVDAYLTEHLTFAREQAQTPQEAPAAPLPPPPTAESVEKAQAPRKRAPRKAAAKDKESAKAES